MRIIFETNAVLSASDDEVTLQLCCYDDVVYFVLDDKRLFGIDYSENFEEIILSMLKALG